MTIDDNKDKGRYGSSGKSPTKFKERPAGGQPHPENRQDEPSPMADDPALEHQEGQDIREKQEDIRAKVRRSIWPGHSGRKPSPGS